VGTVWERCGNGVGTVWERCGNGVGTVLEPLDDKNKD
jgi:hypothetical protein